MIKSFTIKKDSVLSEILFFNKIELKQVTLLLGGNGVGKSSLINSIISRNGITAETTGDTTLFSYINSQQNFREMIRNKNLSYKDHYDPYVIARKFAAEELSEGQSIVFSIQDIFKLCEQIEDNEDALILLDEVDSGLSIDNVEYIANTLKKIAEEQPNIQFVIAFNNYEFCRVFNDVFNMYTGEWMTIDSYETYRNTIKDNRERLLKKRNNNMFTGISDF